MNCTPAGVHASMLHRHIAAMDQDDIQVSATKNASILAFFRNYLPSCHTFHDGTVIDNAFGRNMLHKAN